MHFGYNMDIFVLILVTALHMYPSMTISTNHVRAISTRDYYQNSPSVPVKTNWEIGLKEATYQALIREQIPDPGLKSGIYSAQIQGFQDTATPFGDIAVIARGQLYATPQGYHFVQDPYQNDCDDCHNTPHRCDRRQCEVLNSPNLENLLALWTVKRIRHRDPKFGHRYELQFTISPMSPAASPHFVARNGRFDYSIPGHVFIVKLKDNNVAQEQVKNNFRFDKEHKSSNQKEFKVLPWPHNPDLYNHYSRNQQNNYHNTPNSILLNTGEYFYQKEKTAATTEQHVYNPGFLIGISPNGYKHIIHDIPVLPPPPERPYAVPQRHYIPPPPAPQEPTKEPIKHLHHHFYIPEVEDIDLDKKVTHSTQQPTTQTQKYYKTPTYVITTQNLPETTSPKFVYTPQDTTQSQVSPPLTTDPYFRTTYKYANTDTTIPIFHSESPTYPPRTTLLKVFTIPETSPTQSTSFNPSPFYIHYSEPDPIYGNSQAPTVPTYITQPIVSTLQPTSPTFVTIQDHYTTPTVIDYYDEITHTQATTPTPVTTSTSTKKGKYPDSINAQLPPPDRGADTTVPYVASTAVTIISTPNSIESTTHQIDKDSTNSESKATTIQENIHTTTYEDDDKITTVDIKPRNKFKTTVPYVETTTVIPTITTTTTTTTTSDTISDKPDKNDDDLFAVINVPPRKSNTKTKFTDVDIFGEPKKSTTQSTERITTRTGPSAFDEIFSEFQAQSSTENTNKFLTPHTQLSINVTDALKNARISKYLKYKRNKSNRLSKFRNNTQVTNTNDANGNIETKTSQSLITSISFKVNKNKQENDSTVTPIPPIERLTKGEIDEINEKNKTGYNIYEIQRPNTSTEKSQTFDDVAQTLVNHARIVQYLNSKTTKPTKRSYKNTNR